MRAIYFYRDVCVDLFIIMKRGECIWDGRRQTGYTVQKGIKYGECYDIEYTEEKDASSKREKIGGNYFTLITKKHNSSFEERKQNLFEAMQIIIDEFYTTYDERKFCYEIKKNIFFYDISYKFHLETCFNAIKKLYSQEKFTKEAKIISKYVKDLTLICDKIMCRKVGEAENLDEVTEFVKRVKKRDFGIFTSEQKVIEHIHKLIQQSARKCYNNLIDELQDKTLTHFKYKEKEIEK